MVIFCVVVIFIVVIIACKFSRIEKQIRRNPPEMRPEVAMIPMHVTANSTHRHAGNPPEMRTEVAMIPMHATANSTHRHDGGVATRYEDAPANNNAYSHFRQPSAPVAAAVGGVGTGCSPYEPFARYEALLNDQGRFSRVQPAYETFKGNRPIF